MAEYKLSYTASEIDERLGKVDSLVSSVNGVLPDSNGNVTIPIDTALSETSTNPVQNKVVYGAFMEIVDGIQDMDEEYTTKFETMQNEIDNLSVGGAGSGKELVGEFTLTKDNLTSSSTTGIYNMSSDIQTIMSNIFSTLESGYDVLVAEMTLGDLLMSATCEYFGGSTTLNIAQTIQVAVSTDTEDGIIGIFAFTGKDLRCNTPIQTYASYILAGNINMDVKFYKVSGGSGSNNNTSASGKTLVGEFDLNSTNLTASTTEVGRYSTSTELQETLANIFTTLNKGFDVLIAEFAIDTDIIGGVCTYDLYSDDVTNGTINFTQVSGVCSNLSEDLVNFTLLKNYFLTNISENLNDVFSAGLSVHVKLYTLSGGGSGGGTPYYKDGVVIFDGDVTTELSDGIAGANIETTRIVETSSFDVYIDEVFYSCELKQATMYGTTMAYLGNFYTFGLASGISESELTNMGVTDTKEPFVMVFNPDDPSMIAFMVSEAKTYHVKIEAIKGANKLDSSLIDWAGGGMPSGLPEVTSEDNDKVLVVVNGKWTVASIANGDEVYY